MPGSTACALPNPHRRARLAAGAAFFVQGLLFISLTTRLPPIQTRWDLDELGVSGLLLVVVLLAGLGSVVAEIVAHRVPCAVVVRIGMLVAAGRVVARFNQFNYVGALLGAVLTGVVGAQNLRIGFAVPMVLSLGIIPSAAQFSVIRRRRDRCRAAEGCSRLRPRATPVTVRVVPC